MIRYAVYYYELFKDYPEIKLRTIQERVVRTPTWMILKGNNSRAFVKRFAIQTAVHWRLNNIEPDYSGLTYTACKQANRMLFEMANDK